MCAIRYALPPALSAAAHDAVDRAEHPGRARDAAVVVADSAIRLTKAQARELAEELNDLIDAWRLKGHDAPDAARTYQLLYLLQPAREV